MLAQTGNIFSTARQWVAELSTLVDQTTDVVWDYETVKGRADELGLDTAPKDGAKEQNFLDDIASASVDLATLKEALAAVSSGQARIEYDGADWNVVSDGGRAFPVALGLVALVGLAWSAVYGAKYYFQSRITELNAKMHAAELEAGKAGHLDVVKAIREKREIEDPLKKEIIKIAGYALGGVVLYKTGSWLIDKMFEKYA